MRQTTDDLRIREIKELAPPSHLLREFPVSEQAAVVTFETRQAIHRILHGQDDRLLVVIGPCSIHDPRAALRVRRAPGRASASACATTCEIVMRVYFEKPRTTVGWKGLINDPDLDDSFQHQQRPAHRARTAARHQRHGPAGRHRVPRHDHAAVHRRPDLLGRDRRAHHRIARSIASWPPACPARSASRTAPTATSRSRSTRSRRRRSPHHFLSVTKGGHSAIVSTTGNEDCHVILRGGSGAELRCGQRRGGLPRGRRRPALACRLMIDASHGNSQKKPENQIAVRRRDRRAACAPARAGSSA